MHTTLIKTVRGNAVPYTALLALFSFVMAYQVLASLDTVHVERTYNFYVPFGLQPLTCRIANLAYVASWDVWSEPDPMQRSVPHRGDELLAVNGRPFRGI